LTSKRFLEILEDVICQYEQRLNEKLRTDWKLIKTYLELRFFDVDIIEEPYVISKNDFYVLWKNANKNRYHEIFLILYQKK
jgi:hypothetical protein